MQISICDTLHIKRAKEYNPMIISTDAEKYLVQCQHPSMIKTPNISRNIKNIFQHNEGSMIKWKPTSYNIDKT
jgi:hypothetical protein